jgi:uncharacterized protein
VNRGPTAPEILLEVLVKPGSRAPGVARNGELLVIRVRERAIDGAANVAAGRALAEAYGVPSSAVRLVRGGSARRKRFAIQR